MINKKIRTHSMVYLVENNNRFFGPIFKRSDPKTDPAIATNRLSELSKSTKIGIQTLVQLDSVLRQNNIDVITPIELASLMGTGIRNINRLLLKLEAAGCMTVVGKEAKETLGRPGRIIKISLY